jgi:hypothetical protein
VGPTVTDIPPAIFADAEVVIDLNGGFTGPEAEEIDNVPEHASGLFCEAPGCHAELVYAGRGRRPKKCDEHKRSSTSAKSDRSPGSQVPRGLAKIERDITEAMFTAGVLVSPYDQYDGAVLIASAPKFAEAMTMLAGRYPEFRKWLEKGGDGMMFIRVAMVCLSIGIPIGAHHGLIPMDERVAYQRFVDPKVKVD